MPVITCPHCGKKTIDSSDTCLICGEKINKTPKKKSSKETQAKINKKPILVPIVISLILFGAFIIIQNFDTKNDSEPVLVSTASSDNTDHTSQVTNAPTQTPTLTDDDIELADGHNFHLNYDVLWGSDMNTVEKSMGAPDKYGDNYIVYKNILFDSYPADAVFYFHDNGLIWASMKFHIDSRKTAVSYFEDIQEILTNEFGDPLSETSDLNLYDLTKKIHGYLYWEQPNSKIALNLSNSYADFDDILTYSYADSSAIPSRTSLDKMINDSAEQPTEAPDKPASETVIRRNSDYNANVDYGEYWGCDITAIEEEFGTPDEYGEDSMIYKSILFGTYNSEVSFEFDGGGLCSVTVEFNSYYFMLEDRLKILLMNKFGEFDISLGRNNPTWITPESKVKLYTSRITYEKNQ